MKDIQKYNDYENVDEEVNIVKILQNLWENKLTIIFSTSFFSILAVIYSLTLPDIYESKALLSPVGSESSSSKSMNNIGGLASLAGINLSNSFGGNSAKALEKVGTLSFFKDNILPNIFLPDLMAAKSWDAGTNIITYENNYDLDTKTWDETPTTQESYRDFMDLMTLASNYDTGFVTVSIKHKSPHVAKEWVELIVNQLNYFFRSYDKKEAQLSMDFLNAQIAKTSYTEINQVIAQLLQNKIQQLTLIEANESYVFSYLDPPMVMEEKTEPNRASICILGFILGGLLSILIVFIREFYSVHKNQ
tara:strand:- start:224 stop:1138 length:915 start_codon:yes stop_codon:yes gene_type:complete